MPDESRRWYEYFSFHAAPAEFPWDDPYALSREERAAAAASIQQFQLGENSEGRHLLFRGDQHSRRAGDPWFVPALRLFIAEEQRHAEWLGRFLDRERIPRLQHHWVDHVFRSLRRLAGLELCITVLVTAECIAVAYYRALHEATKSPLLRQICRRILRDEAAHLEYQASTLAALGRGRGVLLATLRYAAHAVFLAITSLVVWQQHRRVFRASRYCWLRLCAEALVELARMQARVTPAPQGGAAAFAKE